MTIDGFVENYYMHDSLIEGSAYDEACATVIMQIDFAFWMQNNYKDSDPETGIIELRFSGVTSYVCPEDIDFSMCSILDMSNEGDTVKFFVLNDFTDEDYDILVTAKEVEVRRMTE